ncbi:hypothetical protein AAX26_01788 [Aliarcobacter thereius]|nr:hypothetical protein AAX27_02163 [Aliarcobacter thereius]OCL85721.1 hypothetical protein AAX26_01788 [Aliarcobacter thereius]
MKEKKQNHKEETIVPNSFKYPYGTEQYDIAEIIGHDNLLKLEKAGYRVKSRRKELIRHIKLTERTKQLKNTIFVLSTQISQSGIQCHPSDQHNKNPNHQSQNFQ